MLALAETYNFISVDMIDHDLETLNGNSSKK